MPHATQVREKPENPLLNLAFNIVLPVLVLNQLSKKMGPQGPLIALILALLLPIGYGAYDYFERRKHNAISVLGFINVAVTGGFALLKLEGMWFVAKEAFFPLLIGSAVTIMNWRGKPLMRTLFWNESIFKVAEVESRIRERQLEPQLQDLFRKATHMFAFSFFLSAILNFVLALSIFTSIDKSLPESIRADQLNQQIAQMHWKGYLIIALPMVFFMGFVMWYVLSRLKKISGMTIEEMMVQHEANPPRSPSV